MTPRDADFHAWAAEQAALLRSLQPVGIDWDGIADELTDLAAGTLRELEGYLTAVITEMLLCARDSTRRSAAAVGENRKRASRLIAENPSLLTRLDDVLAESYDYARDRASGEANIVVDAFPADCPYSWAVVLHG